MVEEKDFDEPDELEANCNARGYVSVTIHQHGLERKLTIDKIEVTPLNRPSAKDQETQSMRKRVAALLKNHAEKRPDKRRKRNIVKVECEEKELEDV